MATFDQIVTGIVFVEDDPSFTREDLYDLINRKVTQVAGGMLIVFPDKMEIQSAPLPELFTIGTVKTYPYSTSLVSLPSDYQRNVVQVIGSDGVEIPITQTFKEFSKAYPLLDDTGDVQRVAVKGTDLYYHPVQSTTTIDGETTISFTASSKTISDSGSGLDFAVGDRLYVSGAGESGNNGHKTVVTVASDDSSCTVSETLTDESAGEEVTILKGETLTVHYHARPTTRTTGTESPEGIPSDFHLTLIVYGVLEEMYTMIEDGIDGDTINTTKYHNKFQKALKELDETIPEDGQPIELYRPIE